MLLIRVARWLPLLAFSLLLASPSASAQGDFVKPGAVWKLKDGGPKPDVNLDWHHKNNRNRIGGGKITFVTQDGIVMQWSYTEPPDQLVVGQTYRLSIQGVSTTHPGPPHKVAHVGIGADAKVMTSPLDGQGIYRNRNMSHGVIPPPLRPDYGNNPIADSIDFVFQPDSFSKSFRVWTHLPADGLPLLIYEYEPFRPAAAGGAPAGAGGAPIPPGPEPSRSVVVRTFQNALPAASAAMIAWSTHVTITWITPTGERSFNKGIFWQPSVKPGVLPALPFGQITFLDQGRLDQVLQFPATALVSIEADALVKWRGEGPTQLPPIARPELTYRDVDRGFYATSSTSTQVHPALFFLPMSPSAVELSGTGVNMFGPGGAILLEQVPTFLVTRLPARVGNPDPMPENVFTTEHTASILTNPAVWPTIASPVSSGWHQLFASQGPQQKPPRLVASIRILFGVGATGGIPPRPPVGAVQPPAAGGFLGCFKDAGDRDLNGASTSTGNMSTEQCTAFCRDRGFSFAGTQYASYCFCDNKYGKYGNASNCDMKCSGNPTQTCGGTWANSVYGTGSMPPVRSGSGWLDGMDASAPSDDPGRGVLDANQHYEYVVRGPGPANLPAIVARRFAAVRQSLSPDLYARLYAESSVLIAQYGRQYGGWKDAMDAAAPPGDPGRGISDARQHYAYAAGPGAANVPQYIGQRLSSLLVMPRDAYARMYAALSVTIARAAQSGTNK